MSAKNKEKKPVKTPHCWPICSLAQEFLKRAVNDDRYDVEPMIRIRDRWKKVKDYPLITFHEPPELFKDIDPPGLLKN